MRDFIKKTVEELKKGSDIEVIVTEAIHSCGIPAHVKGYRFIREAILACLDDSNKLECITKQLYPAIAKANNTTSSRVERAIRHAIELAWGRGDSETLQDFFGNTISVDKGRPTNSEFIAFFVDRISLAKKQVEKLSAVH